MSLCIVLVPQVFENCDVWSSGGSCCFRRVELWIAAGCSFTLSDGLYLKIRSMQKALQCSSDAPSAPHVIRTVTGRSCSWLSDDMQCNIASNQSKMDESESTPPELRGLLNGIPSHRLHSPTPSDARSENGRQFHCEACGRMAPTTSIETSARTLTLRQP